MPLEKIQDLVHIVADHMRLYHWKFVIGYGELEGSYHAKVKRKDYTHFICDIEISEDRKDGLDFDGFVSIIVHELCHIFTGAGSNVYQKHIDAFQREPENSIIHNYSMSFEEQYTNILDRVIYEGFIETKEYKDIKKLSKKWNTKE